MVSKARMARDFSAKALGWFEDLLRSPDEDDLALVLVEARLLVELDRVRGLTVGGRLSLSLSSPETVRDGDAGAAAAKAACRSSAGAILPLLPSE